MADVIATGPVDKDPSHPYYNPNPQTAGPAFQQGQDLRDQYISSSQNAANAAFQGAESYGQEVDNFRATAARNLFQGQQAIGRQGAQAAYASGRGVGGANYGGNVASGQAAAQMLAQAGASQSQQLADMALKQGNLNVQANELKSLAAQKAMEAGTLNSDQIAKYSNYQTQLSAAFEQYTKGFNNPEAFRMAIDPYIKTEQDPVIRDWLIREVDRMIAEM